MEAVLPEESAPPAPLLCASTEELDAEEAAEELSAGAEESAGEEMLSGTEEASSPSEGLWPHTTQLPPASKVWGVTSSKAPQVLNW